MSEIVERVARAICKADGDEVQWHADWRHHAQAAIAAYEAAVHAWQPIATAPKDGTFLLAVRFDQTEDQKAVGAIVHWSRLEEKWFSLAVGAYLIPSHWMPLPTPPEVQS